MKQQDDVATPDLFQDKRPGRPRSGSAKTQAQLQREYRARLRESGARQVRLTAREAHQIEQALRSHAAALVRSKKARSASSAVELVAIADRLLLLFDNAKE